ncbi:glycoside hydrolase [Microbulbifer thermotolerans]|uniref:Glycoside hydrolase n=2 Tax=Microbulbifer thermotolerans TaxID=252514 RepID=A0A143HPJ7_MICTH|nr:glycoside hydrolase [Microbulbifer thermotolerans]
MVILVLITQIFIGTGANGENMRPIPQLVNNNGRYSLMVDGAPYLILGAQTNNSANYPAALPMVWPAVEKMNANTLIIPVAWEQVEPKEGSFDFSFVDILLEQAREKGVRLVLLWFATWKNNGPSYAPLWVKLDNRRFPRVKTADGKTLNSLSPHFRSTLEADKKAFVALMRHLKKTDAQRTVIMVQVQNEVGTYGSVRDFSDIAEKIFRQPVPESLLAVTGKEPGTWRQLFGRDADEFFHAWHIARYVDEIAAAGKAVYPLPMYVNVALRNPFNPGEPGQYSSGGATDNVIHIWKAAAPNIDMISPDIYFRDHKTVTRIMDLYNREDNPLYIAEIGNDQPYARYLFSALGRGALGFTPFGIDYTGYSNYPLGAKKMDSEIAHFSGLYQFFGAMAREWAQISASKRTWGVSEPGDTVRQDDTVWNSQDSSGQDRETNPEDHTQRLDLGDWIAEITYGRPAFWTDPPKGNKPASGGALIAELGANEYLVTALRARVTFYPNGDQEGKSYMLARVEEGHFEQGKWVFERIWNGDQTDWGLNFTSNPRVLKVTLATYQTD